MTIDQLQTYCRRFPGAGEIHFAEPKNILWYHISGKQFAYFKTSEPEKWRFSLRVLPERFLELTDMPGVKPARYMHRFHWVTVVDIEDFPEDYLQELVEWSYVKALNSLSKKKQAAILGQNAYKAYNPG